MTEATNVIRPDRKPSHRCQRHGEHDAEMHVTITDEKFNVVLYRRYCMHCYVEHLDKAGVREMEPIPST